jgi:hypothetical protein
MQRVKKKISNEKRGNPKIQGAKKKTSDEKRSNHKMQGAKKKASDGKRGNPKTHLRQTKIKHDRLVTEGSPR